MAEKKAVNFLECFAWLAGGVFGIYTILQIENTFPKEQLLALTLIAVLPPWFFINKWKPGEKEFFKKYGKFLPVFAIAVIFFTGPSFTNSAENLLSLLNIFSALFALMLSVPMAATALK